MALVGLDGSFLVRVGAGPTTAMSVFQPLAGSTTVDAANESIYFIGHITTSDGGSHTIDTTGSSSLGWRTAAATFADAGTTVKVGLASVLTTAGPPARPSHASDVITFDVSKSHTGGGGGITANAWQTHVPDAGSKTIAHGDLVAFAVQMTARGGADSVNVTYEVTRETGHRPMAAGFVGGSYSAIIGGGPQCVITFSDGALGWFHGSDVFSSINTRTYNSGSATKEYGQLIKLPAPVRVYGLYGWVDPDNDFEFILYSDPLGTPVAERTTSVDANTVFSNTPRGLNVLFSSPYDTTADQNIGVVLKPGASNISAYYKTLASAGHRAADVWGTDGYGISRASGAFADANTGLDHYYVGLLVGGFESGAGRAMLVNNASVVS